MKFKAIIKQYNCQDLTLNFERLEIFSEGNEIEAHARLYIYSQVYERTLHCIPVLNEPDGLQRAVKILESEGNKDLICEVHANNRVYEISLN